MAPPPRPPGRSRNGENVRAGRYAYAVRARPCVRLLDRRPQRALTGQCRTRTVARPGVYGIGRTVDREVGGHGAVGVPHQGEGDKGKQESARHRMSSRSTATLSPPSGIRTGQLARPRRIVAEPPDLEAGSLRVQPGEVGRRVGTGVRDVLGRYEQPPAIRIDVGMEGELRPGE